MLIDTACGFLRAQNLWASLPSTNSTVSSVSVRRDSSTRAVSQMWTSVHLTRAWMAAKMRSTLLSVTASKASKGWGASARWTSSAVSRVSMAANVGNLFGTFQCLNPPCMYHVTRKCLTLCLSGFSSPLWTTIWTTVCPTRVWTAPRVSGTYPGDWSERDDASYGCLRLLAARVPDNSDACLIASENAVFSDLLMSVGNVHLSCDRTHERSLNPENTHLRDGRLYTRLSLLTLVMSFCATARPTWTRVRSTGLRPRFWQRVWPTRGWLNRWWCLSAISTPLMAAERQLFIGRPISTTRRIVCGGRARSRGSGLSSASTPEPAVQHVRAPGFAPQSPPPRLRGLFVIIPIQTVLHEVWSKSLYAAGIANDPTSRGWYRVG